MGWPKNSTVLHCRSTVKLLKQVKTAKPWLSLASLFHSPYSAPAQVVSGTSPINTHAGRASRSRMFLSWEQLAKKI